MKTNKVFIYIFMFILLLCVFNIPKVFANRVGIVDCGDVTEMTEANAEYNRAWKLYIAVLTAKDGKAQYFPFYQRKKDGKIQYIADGAKGYFNATIDIKWPEVAEGVCPTYCNYAWLKFDWELFNGEWDLIRFDHLHCKGSVSVDESKKLYMENAYVIYANKNATKISYYAVSRLSGSFIYFTNTGGNMHPNVDVQQNFVKRYYNKGYPLWWKLDGLKKNLEAEGYFKDYGGKNVIFDSDQTGMYVTSWINSAGPDAYSNKLKEFKKKYQTTLNWCDSIESGSVSNNYNDVIDNMEKALPEIKMLSQVSGGSSNTSRMEQLVSNYIETKLKEKYNNIEIPQSFKLVLEDDIKTLLSSGGFQFDALSAQEKNDIENIKNKFFTCSEKMYKMLLNGDLVLDSTYNAKLQTMYDEFRKITNITVEINSCKDLIPLELIDKLNEYMTILKIIVPIIVVVTGILDFAKAVLGSDDDLLKKAQAKFIKRLIIAVVFFLLPILIKFMLDIVNNVWNVFSGDTCGVR